MISTLIKNQDENKTYILVKTSESFANAIQEYSEPTIKFQGSCGAIKFPNGKSYDFKLEQSDKSVECIRQIKNRWESVGNTACCLHVKGKDDVYERTKTKMEAAEQEKRRYCTKLLDSSRSESTTKSSLTKHTKSTTSLLSNHHTSDHIITTNNNNNNHNHHYNNHHHHHNHHNNNHNHHNNNNGSSNSNINNNHHHHLHHHNNTTSTNKSSLFSSSSSSSSTTSSSSTSSTSHIVKSDSGTSNGNINNLNNNGGINNNANSSCSIRSKYPTINDVTQLKKYKADFDKDFKEYRNLHGYLHKIEERFRKLRELLKQSVEGSPEWELAKEQIFNEYEKVKSDSSFHKARSKYKQLYIKLAHIREKIFQFKTQKRDKSSHSNSNNNNNNTNNSNSSINSNNNNSQTYKRRKHD